MPEDILVPIPLNEQPTHRKPRWHQVVISNGEADADKYAEARGQTVPVRVDGGEVLRAKGEAERDDTLDVRLQFDPTNPDDQTIMGLLDRKIKAAYAAKLAAIAAAAATP